MSKKQFIEDMATDYYLTSNAGSKELVEEYLDNATHLSPKSLYQYKSALKIFLAYVNLHCNNKHLTELKALDFMKYQNWLAKQGLLSAAIRIKRSAISSLNSHIILYHGDEYPTFRNYVSKAVKVPETKGKKEKIPVTDDEYSLLCQELERKESWQKLAYLKFSYITGARKNEARQLLKEVVDYIPVERDVKIKDENGKESIVPIKKYKTNPIKCKGKISADKRCLAFDEDTLFYLKKWLEHRGEDDCPFMFVITSNNKKVEVGDGCFNEWCKEFTKILGRPIFPHLFRSSRATSLYLQGKTLESIQNLLGHKSVETTKIYIVKDDDNAEDEIFA